MSRSSNFKNLKKEKMSNIVIIVHATSVKRQRDIQIAAKNISAQSLHKILMKAMVIVLTLTPAIIQIAN